MFTVVIPVYRVDYLDEAVLSVLDQEGDDLLDELLVVTDGLTADDLPLRAESAGDLRLRVITLPSRSPSTGAKKWNVGIEAAAGEWVVLFADDDAFGPGALAALAEAHGREPEAAVLRVRQWQIDGSGEVIQIGPKHPKHEDWWDHWLSRFLYGRPSCFQEYAFRTDVARAVGGVPDQALGWWTDDVFVIKVAAEGHGIAAESGAFVKWRHDGRNVSAGTIDEARLAEARAAIDELERVLAAHRHEVPFDPEFLSAALQEKLGRQLAHLPQPKSDRGLLVRSMSRARSVLSARD